jgi:arabinofuranosyltransferase
LPNTYYAKHVAAWPESGARYLASFVVEYGIWIPLVVGLVALLSALRKRGSDENGQRTGRLVAQPAALIAIVVMIAHVAYYTFVIGGDHFEYRVYSHLVPWLFVVAIWLVTRVTTRTWLALALVVVFVISSWPIPWTHWRATRDLTTREQTNFLIQPVADRLPVWMRPLTSPWDGWQDWLIRHYVCMRHQEHKIFHRHQVAFLPSREEGAQIGWERRAVLARGNVGVPGWVLPEVAVIDLFGLNDRVIARSPIKTGGERRMAHDRDPIPGYVRCFRPNVVLLEGRAMINRRQITDDEIIACQRRDWLGEDAAGGGGGSE